MNITEEADWTTNATGSTREPLSPLPTARWLCPGPGPAPTSAPGSGSLGSHSQTYSIQTMGLAVAPALETLLGSMRLGFLLHVYGLACLFAILALYTFFSLLNLRSLISSRPFMSSINAFLCLLGATRAFCLSIDPYNLRQALPRILGAVMGELAFPCLTSAFCLVQLAFLQLTQLKAGPKYLRHKSVPSLVIAAHFSFVMGINILQGVFPETALPFKYIGHTIFLLWGLFLFSTFLFLCREVRSLLNRVPRGVLLQRDPNDCQNKGIMQLAVLAPYSNLASSVAAALVPTLLAPKIRISSETDQKKSDNGENQGVKKGTIAPAGPSTATQVTVKVSPSPSPKPSRRDSQEGKEETSLESAAVALGVVVRPPTPTIMVCPGSRRGSTVSLTPVSRRGSGIMLDALEGPPRRKSAGAEALTLAVDDMCPPSRRASQTSLLRITEESSEALAVETPPRRKKSLSWKEDDDLITGVETNGEKSSTPQQPKSEQTDADESATAETKLLPVSDQEDIKGDDLTLHSILNHIAYVNRGPHGSDSDERARAVNRRRQLHAVIDLTSATACIGLALCIAELFQIYGPYGRLAGTCSSGAGRARPWIWFIFQTFCRLMELAMGCAMANVTKQPVTTSTPYLNRPPYAAGLRIKRESLYL